MANYWAIATGINHYQDPRIQPLMFAQRDAQLLTHYWANEAHFPPDQCLLLADLSPAIEVGVIQPNRANIQQAIARLFQQEIRPQAVWWFFSGYGIQVNGDDYLLPIDADLTAIETTAISVESVFQQLSQSPAKTAVVLLDIHRSAGIWAGQTLGTQTIELARRYGIPTFLSCAPDQHSHETLSLRSGLFTAALLEALRHDNCVTPDQLSRYLTPRLPELSDHLWRPRQDAIAIIPDDQRYALIMPGLAAGGLDAGWSEDSFQANPFVFAAGEGAIASDLTPPPSSVATLSPNGWLSKSAQMGKRLGEVVYRSGPSAGSPNGHNGQSSVAPTAIPDVTSPSPQEISDTVFWRRLILWGGLLALALLAGVLLNNWSELLGGTADETSTVPSDVITPLPPSPVPWPAEGSPPLPSPDPATEAVNPSPPVNPSPNITAAFITDPIPSDLTDRSSPTPSLEPFTTLDPLPGEEPSPGEPSPTASAVGIPATDATATVQGALANRNYPEALQRLTQMPPSQRPAQYDDWLQQAAQGTLLQARAAVSRVRAETVTNQASDFNLAIQLARRLRPDHPYYRDAQRDISTWSEVIYQLARGRASQPNQGSVLTAARNYSSAIAAAQLVPADQGDIYRDAQTSVAQWSQEIYTLAQRQGQIGQFASAIQLARLIPQRTPTYATAQWAIANWQAQLPPQPR